MWFQRLYSDLERGLGFQGCAWQIPIMSMSVRVKLRKASSFGSENGAPDRKASTSPGSIM